MRVCATSDLHGYLPEGIQCDLLLIAGDICPAFDHSLPVQRKWLQDTFNPWLNSINAEKVMIWGNHDFIGETDHVPNIDATILTNESYNYQGVNIFGTPYTPWFYNWAFNSKKEHILDGTEQDLVDMYKEFPSDIDIMVSHGPPKGYMDECRGGNVGSLALRRYIDRVQPKYVVCGHIHEAAGSCRAGLTQVINCSYVDHKYKPKRSLFYFDF